MERKGEEECTDWCMKLEKKFKPNTAAKMVLNEPSEIMQ